MRQPLKLRTSLSRSSFFGNTSLELMIFRVKNITYQLIYRSMLTMLLLGRDSGTEASSLNNPVVLKNASLQNHSSHSFQGFHILMLALVTFTSQLSVQGVYSPQQSLVAPK